MKIFTSLYHNNLTEDTAVAVGKFDGIHKGHELLTQKLLQQEQRGFRPLVVTFDVSPRLQLNKDRTKLLITNEERRQLLEQEGIAYLAECPFKDEIQMLEPERFIELLMTELRMRYMVCGTDFRFGSRGRGDTALLKELSEKMGFQLEVLEKLLFEKRDISSTFVREEIAAGHVAEAEKLLGYPYFIWGTVVHGNHIGRTLGMPTINLYPPEDKLLPENGVYVTRIELEHKNYHGVTNVGVKPTVGEKNRMGIETHILDFHEDVYDKKAKVVFLERLRPEIRFNDLEELRRQMRLDKKNAAAYFNKRPV